MTRRPLHIGALSLRLAGRDAGEGRAFAHQLGDALAARSATLGAGSRNQLKLRMVARPGEGRRALAERIARAIEEGLK